MKESRHRIILQELDQTGVVAVKNLKEMLGVTDMTIRRDLIDLEKQGMLTRVHGGAHKKVKNALNEISHSEKQMLNVEEKKQIARKCADLIADGDTVLGQALQRILSETIWMAKISALSPIRCQFLKS
mgnify:CR=1 FL=1